MRENDSKSLLTRQLTQPGEVAARGGVARMFARFIGENVCEWRELMRELMSKMFARRKARAGAHAAKPAPADLAQTLASVSRAIHTRGSFYCRGNGHPCPAAARRPCLLAHPSPPASCGPPRPGGRAAAWAAAARPAQSYSGQRSTRGVRARILTGKCTPLDAAAQHSAAAPAAAQPGERPATPRRSPGVAGARKARLRRARPPRPKPPGTAQTLVTTAPR